MAKKLRPPVKSPFISRLERGQALGGVTTVLDLARIFGSIEIEDELGYRYVVVYKGKIGDLNLEL